jgi:uncharacterized protein YutE (UPF0331/DUF86 family)
MNERIQELAEQSELNLELQSIKVEKFAELIVRECADICMEMAAKCAGLEGDGALAKDCAYWIKKDFGVEE